MNKLNGHRIKRVRIEGDKEYDIHVNATKIEEYEELGMHCAVPFIRVLNYSGDVICEAPKAYCVVFY